MSAISEGRVVRAIFTHSNSAHERSIASQIDEASGADRSRLIDANRSLWLHYERIAREEKRKFAERYSNIEERVEKSLQLMDIDKLEKFAGEGNDLAIEELKKRGH